MQDYEVAKRKKEIEGVEYIQAADIVLLSTFYFQGLATVVLFLFKNINIKFLQGGTSDCL